MKKKAIYKQIEEHHLKKRYTQITRKRGKFEATSTGFILDKSKDFILLQETDDFRIMGYQIIPIYTISDVRYNGSDKAYERILKKEGSLSKVKSKHKINLTSWNSICKDIQKTGLTVISECEYPEQSYFCIGELKKVNKKTISIRYFNAEGVLDKENTKHKFIDITKLSFDDRYANVFSKYLSKK